MEKTAIEGKRKKITMYFHCAGVVSEEEWEAEVGESRTRLFDSETEWIFDNATGKCLNDNTTLRVKRTIKPSYNQNKQP